MAAGLASVAPSDREPTTGLHQGTDLAQGIVLLKTYLKLFDLYSKTKEVNLHLLIRLDTTEQFSQANPDIFVTTLNCA
ncbi:hypothetical protein RRG08_037132 [Elysia crispata]|uniref:Uncharacterized protein n=1 Tax=Elysia crispata TaxID=231223 RepID=A0AAE0Y514_9GAST|nr:hypothetical protein RRG08_037132 [Elysia crispata]